jgi:secreted trypsin-like serine protease
MKTKLLGWCVAVSALSSCGRDQASKLDIIGGQAVKPSDPIAHYIGALVSRDGAVKCTVTPIAESTFATAAHCVYGRDLEGWSIQTGLVIGKGESLDIDQTMIHRDFSGNSLYSAHPVSAPNDIALIHTRSPSAGTIPVPIIRGIKRQELTTPFTITVAGYGRTDGQLIESKGVLQKVKLTVTQTNRDLHEFTSEDADGRMGCHGDSGGPAFYEDAGKLFLIGITSRGDHPCKVGATIFTDILDFSTFIKDSLTQFNLEQHGQAPSESGRPVSTSRTPTNQTSKGSIP